MTARMKELTRRGDILAAKETLTEREKWELLDIMQDMADELPAQGEEFTPSNDAVTVRIDGKTGIRFPNVDRMAEWLAGVMQNE